MKVKNKLFAATLCVAFVLACTVCVTAAPLNEMYENGIVSDGEVTFGDIRDGIVSDVSEDDGMFKDGIFGRSSEVTTQENMEAVGSGGAAVGIVIAVIVVVAVIAIIFFVMPRRK